MCLCVMLLSFCYAGRLVVFNFVLLFLQFVREEGQPKRQRWNAKERQDERGGNATSINGWNGTHRSISNMPRQVLFLPWPSQEDDSQQAVQDSIQLDEVNGSAALSDIRLDDTIDETKEDEIAADEKVENATDDKVEEDKAQRLDKNEEKDTEIQWDKEGDTAMKSRDRPKSVLKNKTPTPVITTSTTPNPNTTNPHRDRECCNIS